MPELPEVETIRRQLDTVLPGARVTGAGSIDSDRFRAATRTIGASFTAVNRRGKYLIVPTDDGRELILHLGMTGTLRFDTEDPRALDGERPWRRAWWTFADGRILGFDDQRRFGRVAVVEAGRYDDLGTLAGLGPEPLGPEFTPTALYRALRATRRHVKTALLSQRVVAGIGNIYADEALWRSAVSPVARRVSLPRATRLHGAIVEVLSAAVAHGGTRLRDYRTIEGDTGRHQWHLDCYGRAGMPCSRCGTTLRRRLVDGRGTTWCPTCQAR